MMISGQGRTPKSSDAILDIVSREPIRRIAGFQLEASGWAAFGVVLGFIEEYLSMKTGRSISFSECVDDSPHWRPQFGVQFRIGESGREFGIAMDEEAGRCILDAAGDATGWLRGAGQLSDAELGILEFIVLDIVNRILSEVLPGCVIKIVAFQTRRDFAHEFDKLESRPILYSVGNFSRPALVAIFPSAFRVQEGATLVRVPAGAPAKSGIVVRLALPKIDMKEAELQDLEPGDVLLLFTKSLLVLEAPVLIVTTTGWVLGEATVVEESTGEIVVKVLTLAPQPFLLEKCKKSNAWAIPIIGEVFLPAASIRSIAPAATLRLKRTNTEVVLECSDGQTRQGSLVHLDGIVGIQITRSSSHPGTPG